MSEEAINGPSDMTAQNAGAQETHPRGLLYIGIFKLAKSIFFFFVGMGAFHLLHKDLNDEAQHLASTLLRYEPEGRLTALIMENVQLIDPRRLREIGFFTFAYSVLALIEGYGLMREKVWAEYLTLSITVMFLPWELFELVRHASWMRLSLLLINLAVLAYLLWILERKKKTNSSPN
jgi:uncharacterized membrane protein (DUF2068 family)